MSPARLLTMGRGSSAQAYQLTTEEAVDSFGFICVRPQMSVDTCRQVFHGISIYFGVARTSMVNPKAGFSSHKNRCRKEPNPPPFSQWRPLQWTPPLNRREDGGVS